MTAADGAFDPFSANFASDPYATYRTLRARAEPLYFPAADAWLIARYADVAAIATHPAMRRSLDGVESAAQQAARRRKANWHDMPYHERFVQKNLLESDGEPHRRLRRQVFGHFRAIAVARLAPAIRAFVDRLLDDVDAGEEINFVETVAARIPGRAIALFLGAPEIDAPQLRDWSERVVRYFDVDRTDDKKAVAEQATREFHDYLQDLIAARRRAPRDDLITALVGDCASGVSTPDDCVATAMLILMAGHGSSIDMLGNAMHLLIKRPDVDARLRREPDLWPTALQEMFRYEPPLPAFHRHATEAVEISGRAFAAGDTFILLYASANRDPAAFDAPDAFDPERAPNRHLAFGLGPHLCLGNHLARMNVEIALRALCARFDRFEAAAPVVYKRGLSVRGPETLPLRMLRGA